MLLRWGRGGTAALPPAACWFCWFCAQTPCRPGLCLPSGLHSAPGHQASTFTTPADVPGQPPPMGAVRPFAGGPPLGAVPWLPLITLVPLAAAESVLSGG